MRGNQTLSLFACAVMDLCWLYAGATFLTTAILRQAFPLPEAVGAFFLATVLTLFSSGRGWRIITIVALQTLFFVPALLIVVHVFSSWSSSFAQQAWLTSSFPTATAAEVWAILMLLLVWIFPFWGGGMRLARRTLDYDTICSRFDRGLIAFFVLLLFKFVLRVRGDITIELPVFEYLIGAFFIFSLLAIGLVRNQTTTVARDFIPGYQGIGVIIGFAAVVLLCCAVLTFFWLAYLTLAAEKSYAILKQAIQPLGSLFMIIIYFVFGKRADWTGQKPEQPPLNIPRLDAPAHHSWWVEFFGRILAWGIWILLGLILLFIVGTMVYFFVQWLFSKTDLAIGKAPPRLAFARWMEKLRIALLDAWQQIVRAVKVYRRGYREVKPLYGALRTWGRRSGMPPFISETPAEYGLRLQRRFPVLKQEIALIIEYFHEEVYGGITLACRQLTLATSAWCRMSSARHWPRRLRTLFFRSKEESPPFP